jgi:hypothetical protein
MSTALLRRLRMKRIPLEEFTFPALTSPGIGEKNTVSNGPDDGTLNCNAGHFWHSMRHGSTKVAIDNALTPVNIKLTPPAPGKLITKDTLSGGALNIGGHGNDGQFETGSGQSGFDLDKFVYLYNEDNWGPQFERIKPTATTVVSIWACHPGAGDDGADLLFAMAKRCGRAVRGGTGFLYCSAQSLYWENGSVWQAATPTNRPNPIAAPSPHLASTSNTRFQISEKEFEATEVESVEVTLMSFGRSSSSYGLRRQVAQSAVANLFRSDALEMNVAVAAMVTGTLKIAFSGSMAAEFIIYNDRLAVDRKSGTGYYVHSVRSLNETLSLAE